MKRSQDDLLDGDGEDGELDQEAMYEAGAFESGETSGVTTRASTPHGGSAQHLQHAAANPRSGSHSHSSSSESLHSQHSPVPQAEDSKGEEGAAAAGAAVDSAGVGKIASSVANLSLAPITPLEAEALVRREALLPGNTTRTPTTSTLSTTPRSGGKDGHGAHHHGAVAGHITHNAHTTVSSSHNVMPGVHQGSDSKLNVPPHNATDAATARKHG